jgi:hypothetical protein
MEESNHNTKKEKLTVFDKFAEAVGWLQIVLSPILIVSFIAVPFYLATETKSRLIISGLLMLAGLIVGIVWANRIAKKYGTINFISRIHGTPELDKEEKGKT